MDEKVELKQELKHELQHELQWVKYRQKMLDIMEEKLLQMKQLSEQVKKGNLYSAELEVLNNRLNNLAKQVKALDSESRSGKLSRSSFAKVTVTWEEK